MSLSELQYENSERCILHGSVFVTYLLFLSDVNEPLLLFHIDAIVCAMECESYYI